MATVITQTANPAGVASSGGVSTYSGVSIGAAAPNRIVVVLVGTEVAAGSINSVTLGGVAMTAGTQGNQTSVYARAFYLLYPTGTIADVAVTFGADTLSTNNHIAVYTVVGGTYSSTGADQTTDMDATDPLTTGSTTIGTGGGMIAVVSGGSGTGGAKTWSNLGEDLDADGGSFSFCTAFSTTAGTATRTCTGSVNGEDGAMSWLIFTANASPTIALNSPADSATGVSTTPVLDFTGTDSESNDVRYEVQVDTVNTFDSQSGSPLIDAVSGTDAGFANPDNGGDTDPFTSGENIQYTVQSALSNSTVYYWRVRGIDPSGSNTYGAWATTRSFTTTAGGAETREPNPVTATLSVVAPTKSYQAVISRSPFAVALSLAIAAVTTSYLQIGSASPNPVTTTLAVAAPSTSYAEAYSRSPSALSTTLSVASPSTSYVYVGSASPDPVTLTSSIAAPTKSYEEVITRSPSPVSITLSTVAPTKSYIQVESRSPNPLTTTLSVAAPTAGYTAGSIVFPTPLISNLSVIAPSVLYVQVESRSPNPVTTTLSVVQPASDYSEIVSRSPNPVALTSSVVAPSTSYLEGSVANPTPLTITISAVAPSTSYLEEYTVSPVPLTLTISVVAPTAEIPETWVLKSKTDQNTWDLKDKTAQSYPVMRILTPDGNYILVGVDEDQVLIYSESSQNWQTMSKQDATWALKGKTTQVTLSMKITTPDGNYILVGSSEDEILTYQAYDEGWDMKQKESGSWLLKTKINR